MAFQKLVRFELDGKASYGDLLETTDTGYTIKKFNGNPFDGLQTTEVLHNVSEVSHEAPPY
jgi:hypothetical protein